MTTPTEEKHRAIAATAIATGMEAALDQGVPDGIIATTIVNIALGLIGAAHGGPTGIPDALERLAAQLRDNPDSPATLN